jgi:LDH2 family malate/lactate/ureidoglycolate dehydrogenase
VSPPLRFHAPALRVLVAGVLERVGAPAGIAALVADHLVDANLTGHDSHGVLRLPDYVRQAREGILDPAGRPRLVRDSGPTASVSGEWGFGQAGAVMATDEAVLRARRHGVAAVALVRCTHLGRLGNYMERACAEGVAALAWVGGLGLTHAAVPYGGSRGAYGANPVAAGFPTDAGPVVLDFATTAVAGGKVLVAHAAGEQLAPGSIVDDEGRPTTDPAAFIAGGALLAFGGHKGYALAVIAELLGQALTGSDLAGEEGFGGETFPKAGALFIALDPGAFRLPGEALQVATGFVERVRAVPPAPGFDAVYLPGEPEALRRAERERDGIPVEQSTWEAIVDVAADLDVTVPTPRATR